MLTNIRDLTVEILDADPCDSQQKLPRSRGGFSGSSFLAKGNAYANLGRLTACLEVQTGEGSGDTELPQGMLLGNESSQQP
jgi:hypothetical protein